MDKQTVAQTGRAPAPAQAVGACSMPEYIGELPAPNATLTAQALIASMPDLRKFDGHERTARRGREFGGTNPTAISLNHTVPLADALMVPFQTMDFFAKPASTRPGARAKRAGPANTLPTKDRR